MSDPFHLERFVEAQAPIYDRALAEIRAGAKRSHWMWFIFPQVAGLGFSPMAQAYAISGLPEARAYLAHPVLGPRLIACAQAAVAVEGRGAREVFGSPDDMKFRSCMTLFAHASSEPVFRQALARYFDGAEDPLTVAKL